MVVVCNRCLLVLHTGQELDRLAMYKYFLAVV